ncbi:MAG: FAD-binding oxidoreductase [Planctomycetota bacterium]
MIDLADKVRGLIGPRAVADLDWRGRGEPFALALPESVDEIVELLRFARAERVPVAPIGTGSKLGWARPPREGALVVSTRRLQHLVEYEPAEGVITALAGTRMATLRAAANEHGHWLTPDVPAAENATLGGVIAAGQSGLDRVRLGPVRHHVLGVRAVMADGTTAKSGGRLVKNVTGFDLPRLFTGSHGTLCVIVEATLRLAVAPRQSAVVVAHARDAAGLAGLARAVMQSRARPFGLQAARDEGADGAWALFARLGGHAEVVRDERELLLGLWKLASAFEGDAALEHARHQRELDFTVERRPWLHATCTPHAVPGVVAAFDRALAPLGVPTRMLAQPSLASVDAQVRAPEGAKLDAARWIELLHALRAELRPLGATLVMRDPTRRIAESGAPWPPLESGAALMRTIRDRLDPDGVFARGRFEEDL